MSRPQTAAPRVVDRFTLANIKRDRARLARLRADAAALAEDLHERERLVIEAIEDGALVDGRAEVLTQRRQNVSWLTVVARALGEEAIERVKNDWPVTFYKTLQIS